MLLGIHPLKRSMCKLNSHTWSSSITKIWEALTERTRIFQTIELQCEVKSGIFAWFPICLIFPSTMHGNCKKFVMKIRWIYYTFEDIYARTYLSQYAEPSHKGLRGRPQETLSDICYDDNNHWVVPQVKQTCCTHCHAKTTTRCEKCDIRLHVKCFKQRISRSVKTVGYFSHAVA